MSAISITTLGMYDGPCASTPISGGGGGVIVKEEEIKRPGILVLDMSLRDDKYKKINENFITVKSVNFK